MSPLFQPDDLPADDLPTADLTQIDRQLRRQLDEVLMRRFEEHCDPLTQQLLLGCDWYITTEAKAVTLVIDCPNTEINWHLLNHVPTLGQHMAQFSPTARLRICPPPNTGTPFEIRVDELSIYRDPE